MQSTGFKSFSVQELPKGEVTVESQDFRSWANQHHYRTSYRDMSKKVPGPEKKFAIPGYCGYIPGVAADNNFGKTFTEMSREQLNRDKYLPERTTESFPNRPVTSQYRTQTRFGGGLDDEYHTVSRFHGKSTIPMTHPNYKGTPWQTSQAAAYTPPEPKRSGMFRTTNLGEWRNAQPCPRPATQSSGFVGNSTYFDGHGWVPMTHLHGDLKKTEYRNRFNMYVPFHPKPLKPNPRKMKKREFVY